MGRAEDEAFELLRGGLRPPTVGETIGQGVDYAVDAFSPIVSTIADFLPVIGDVKSAMDALDYYDTGDYGMAGLSALGAIPVLGTVGDIGKSGVRVLMKTPEITEGLKDVARASQAANESDIATQVIDFLKTGVKAATESNATPFKLEFLPERIEYKSYADLADDLLNSGEYGIADLGVNGLHSNADFARRMEENGVPLVYFERPKLTFEQQKQRYLANLGREPSLADDMILQPHRDNSPYITLADPSDPSAGAVLIHGGNKYGPNDLVPGSGGFPGFPDVSALQVVKTSLPLSLEQHAEVSPILRLFAGL